MLYLTQRIFSEIFPIELKFAQILIFGLRGQREKYSLLNLNIVHRKTEICSYNICQLNYGYGYQREMVIEILGHFRTLSKLVPDMLKIKIF